MISTKERQSTSKNRSKDDITNSLDDVISECYLSHMFQSTVRESMHSRLRREGARMKEIDARLGELAQAYHEYQDLQDEATERKQRMETLAALVGLQDVNPPESGEYNHEDAQKYLTASAEHLRESLPLWKAMQEYLSHVKEARIAEMESFFQEIEYSDGNRQAIESALRFHPKVFKIRKQKREKYISLK